MTNVAIQTTQLDATYSMNRASVEDTQDVMTLLRSTAKWFQQNGSTQWSGLLKGEDSHRTEEAIVRGDVFVAKNEGVLAGMVMLLPLSSAWDRSLWSLDENNQEDAVYLHRLAIHRDFANAQLGSKILGWCQQSIHFPDKRVLRLDCIANNQFLNEFYQRNDFTYVGEKDGYSLYEYPYVK